MKPLFHLLTAALILAGGTAVQAQSFKYSNIRKDYVFDDGFGVPHSKTVSQQGDVRIAPEEVHIDGSVYRMAEKGVYRNAKGKAVDLSFSYQGSKLVAVRLSTGHIINNYMLDNSADQGVVVQK
jgi:hypothetical protein